MSSSKRRKLSIEGSPQPMSAFALRKKLLAQQSQLASPSIDQANVSGTPSDNADEGAPSPLKKARKTRALRPTSVELASSSQQSSELRPEHSSIGLLGHPMAQADETATISPPNALEEGQDNYYYVNRPVQPVNFSTFRPSKANFRKRKDKVLQVKLVEGEKLMIYGSYGVRVESGEVTVYGATLKASKDLSWIHAPQSHALPVIRCADDATVELHPHPVVQELKELGRLSPLFRRLWWEDPSLPSQDKGLSGGTFQILYTSEDGPKKAIIQDLKTPPEWNREVAALVALKDAGPSSTMITGPKSSGKSTFGKILTNRLLTSARADRKKSGYEGVVVLDLDPGQPEYCGIGQIALILVTKPVLSPPFCRPVDRSGIRTIRSHALAALSPASDPELYTEMALDLVAHYRNAYGSYPLVINTPGWIQGTGLDLLVSLIGELRPSRVVYMSQLGPVDTVEALEGACTATNFFSTLPSQPNQNGLRTATDLRSMQTMAYFHTEGENRGGGDDDHLHWFPKPITAMPPWQVRFRGDGAGIAGVLFYNFQTQADLVADAINGTILAVVEVESTEAFRGIAGSEVGAADDDAPGSPMDVDGRAAALLQSTSFSLVRERVTAMTPEGIPFMDTSHGLTLDPRYSRCLGLVLVRGIDVANGTFHLLSPITAAQIEDVGARGGHIVLVSGKLDAPGWAYTEDLYFQSEGDDGEANEGLDQGEGSKDTSEDVEGNNDSTGPAVPWIETLTRNQKRSAGAKAWRVRRDIGRLGGD
ncbi:hypothetical protein GGR50DRAFT_677206 [Xylaria sp. CBS 124048]|nr:hypothetical protein GGR50DRAFT_677206 [Xylaria sp. CBS 124048]